MHDSAHEIEANLGVVMDNLNEGLLYPDDSM